MKETGSYAFIDRKNTTGRRFLLLKIVRYPTVDFIIENTQASSACSEEKRRVPRVLERRDFSVVRDLFVVVKE
jgi:hypothetical protein